MLLSVKTPLPSGPLLARHAVADAIFCKAALPFKLKDNAAAIPHIIVLIKLKSS
jgi:hypothetical protein